MSVDAQGPCYRCSEATRARRSYRSVVKEWDQKTRSRQIRVKEYSFWCCKDCTRELDGEAKKNGPAPLPPSRLKDKDTDPIFRLDEGGFSLT